MKKFLSLMFCLLLLSACGMRREYYEPEKIDAKLSYDEKLKSSIIETNLNFARLKNDTVLDKNGVIENFSLEEDFMLLKHEDNEFVIADKDGNLKIISADKEELYHHKFDAAVLSIALSGDDMALLLADNSIILANRSLGIKMSQTLSAAPAQDSRVAAPIFLDSIILYPSLDGKLVIVDKASQKVIRDVIVSSGDFFNNVIYLNVIDDVMIAATSKKVVVVSPDETFSYDEEIRTVVVADEIHANLDKNNQSNTKQVIFIFAKNGNIIKTDLHLNKLIEKKFKFAIYNTGNVFNGFLYVFEKTGYLIKSDLALKQVQVYKLKGAADEKAFMREGRFYFANKILNLP